MCENVYGGMDEARGQGIIFLKIVGLSIIAC